LSVVVVWFIEKVCCVCAHMWVYMHMYVYARDEGSTIIQEKVRNEKMKEEMLGTPSKQK